MSFIRKYKVGDRVYLAEVESRRVHGKIVQRYMAEAAAQWFADAHPFVMDVTLKTRRLATTQDRAQHTARCASMI